MTSQLLSCLVIVLVINLHTKHGQSNPLRDDAVSDSDHQTFINEFSKAAESATEGIKNITDKYVNLANRSDIQNMIDQIKEINLEEIEGIKKEDRDLYKKSLSQLTNAKKELKYIRINLETYATITIDRAIELSRVIDDTDSKQTFKEIKGRIKYSAKKMVNLVDQSQRVLNTVIARFEIIDSKLSEIGVDMSMLKNRVKALQNKKERERDLWQDKIDFHKCASDFAMDGWLRAWCYIQYPFFGVWWSIHNQKYIPEYEREVDRIADVLDNLLDTQNSVKAADEDVNKQFNLVNKWRDQIDRMSGMDFKDEESLYRGVYLNKKGILRQLTGLKQICENYINNGKKD